MHNESFHALRSVRAGANGYISKQEPPEEVLKAIRKVLAGEIYWPEKVAMETVNRLANKRFVSTRRELPGGFLSVSCRCLN